MKDGAPTRTRTWDPRIRNPQADHRKSLVEDVLTTGVVGALVPCLVSHGSDVTEQLLRLWRRVAPSDRERFLRVLDALLH